MGDTTTISARLAQRRVALLLLPLRLWLGVGWLRAGVSKALQPEWFDGSAFAGWLQGQPDAVAAPLPPYTDLVAGIAERAATPLGITLVMIEIAIGLGLLTGTLTNLALLSAIMLNVHAVLAGSLSPSQYYIVIEVVLLAGGAGAAYGGDRWLSQVVRSALLIGHRGLIDGVEAPRSLLVLLAIATGGLGLAVVPRVATVLPGQAGDDAAFVLLALLMVVALLALLLARATHRTESDDDEGWADVGEAYGASQLPPRPGHQDHGLQPAPAPAPQAADPWSPAPTPPAVASPPAPVAATPRPAVQDQPTTQFVRPRRSPAPQRPTDPYAELRDLPPVQP